MKSPSSKMEAKCSSLTEELGNVIDTLHSLFDEIGLSRFEREQRETSVYAALNAALQEQVRLNSNEKNDLVEQCQHIISSIKQLRRSLNDPEETDDDYEDTDLQITYPLLRCREELRKRQEAAQREFAEQYEQVKKLIRAMQSYAEHLEDNFVQIPLPPITDDPTQVASFNISHAYVNELDQEFSRVYQEYTRRVATVQTISTEIVQLWAELGTPSIQTDQTIVKCYRDAPEQLGLREEDIRRLKGKKEKLIDEKESREKKMNQLKDGIQAMWEKLGIPDEERREFLASHRGYGLKCLKALEEESNRLLELKRQNLHIFVEDARHVLQDLWDRLYFSEEEMLDFSPAFSDVYTDALLSAHEIEISRLEKLLEEREPIISLIDKHKSLIDDKEHLAIAANDASRLMSRGPRDPTRLLREEKMRKRIAKELPKVEVELKKALEDWQAENGKPFMVHGEDYLETLIASMPAPRQSARSATSSRAQQGTLSRNNSVQQGTLSRNNSVQQGTLGRASSVQTPSKQMPPPTRPGTATGHTRTKSQPPSKTASQPNLQRPKTPVNQRAPPPSRTPTSARPPVSGYNTLERSHSNKAISKSGGAMPRKQPSYSISTIREAPPKMGTLSRRPTTPSAPNRVQAPSPTKQMQPRVVRKVQSSRHDQDADETPKQRQYRQPLENEQQQMYSDDDYDDYSSTTSTTSSSRYATIRRAPPNLPTSSSYHTSPVESVHSSASHRSSTRSSHRSSTRSSARRVPSGGSSASLTSGYTNATSSSMCSENWETFEEDDDDEESEPDAREAYYGKLRMAQRKRVQQYQEPQEGVNAGRSSVVQILRSDDEWDEDDY